MVSSSRLALPLVVGLLLVGPLVVGPASGAPPPRPVCAPCGDALEDRAAEHGLSLAVTNSTATVVVHDNTTATWVVRNTIRDDETLTRLRQNETLRRTLVEARYFGPDLRSVTVSEDGVLIARYVQYDFATRSVGDTLRVDAFSQSYGYRNLDGLGADRLVVEAPNGTAVRSSVPGSEVTADRSKLVLTSYDRGGFVTFVPRERPVGSVWSWLAVADLVGPVILLNGLVAVVLPAGLLAGAVGATGNLLRKATEHSPWAVDRPARILFAGGGTALLLSLAGGLLGALGTTKVLLFGCGAGTLALGVLTAGRSRDRLGFRHVLAGAAVGTGIAVVAAMQAGSLFYGRVPWIGIRPRLPLFLAVFAFLPAGFAVGHGRRLRAGLTIAAGVAVSSVLTTPLATPVRVVPLAVQLLSAIGDSVGILVVGVPLLLFGTALAGKQPAAAVSGATAQSDDE